MPFTGKVNFVQINHSFNAKKGTFRGMHFQNQPNAEGKLIRCISGGVVDFVVDLRKGSVTFLRWIKVELNSKNRQMIFIPKGCAHGFQTLEDDTELVYHHTVSYRKESDSGVRFDDPLINIKLPLEISMISEKDKSHVLLDVNFKGIEL